MTSTANAPGRIGGPLRGEDAELFSALRLRASRSHPYFAAALFALIPRAAPGLDTFAVDVGWRLHADPDVMRRWTIEEATSVLIHEVHHLVRDHQRRGLRIDGVDHWLWNLATDAAINDDLLREGLPLPSPVLPRHLGLDPGGVEEGYYREIVHGPATQPPASVTGGQDTCGSGAGGRPSQAELAGGGDTDTGDDTAVSETEAETIRHTVAAATLEAHERGDAVSASLVLWARQLTRPRVPWERVLRSAVRQSIRAVTGDPTPTHARPDRRSDSRPDFVYPGHVRRQASIAVVIDTSRSMSSRLLDAALTEIHGICARSGAPTTAVISCDAAAYEVQEVRTAAEVDLTGGGGTDMRVGIDAAAALRPAPDIVVVLTDGLTPWPAKAPHGIRLVAVVLGDRGDQPSGPGITACRIPTNAL